MKDYQAGNNCKIGNQGVKGEGGEFINFRDETLEDGIAGSSVGDGVDSVNQS